MMKKFVIRSLPYILIGLIYGAVGEYYLISTREAVSIESITDIQSKSKKELYYGREILGNSLSNYKYHMFIKTQPKVLVLGQSVTLQFRDFMFEPYEDNFYNTGLMARNVKDLNYVLDMFESGKVKKPQLVLLGIDPSFVLQHTFLDKTEWVRNYPGDRATSAKSHLKGIQRLYLDEELRQIPQLKEGYGKAGMIGLGYRNDGSYRHKPEMERYLRDSSYYDGILIEKLKNRQAPFIEPFAFSRTKADKLLKAINRFYELDIELLLYIPPYSHVYYSQAIQYPMFTSFWEGFIGFQEELINEGHNVIPFCTPPDIGLNDDYFVDAEHPGEVMCAIQLRNFVRSGKGRGKVLNSLTFNRVDELLQSENTIPMSFMTDSLSVVLLQEIRNKRATRQRDGEE